MSKNAIKKGLGLKTVVSDFLPEVRSQSVRFTLSKIVHVGDFMLSLLRLYLCFFLTS
jgi:hypothetical protein